MDRFLMRDETEIQDGLFTGLVVKPGGHLS